ncbi:MAG: rsmA, partial [Verrucomicrobiaceae bacterium]|nr:rsmA [Verrucomicrobiaceae bacterium]
MQFTAKKSLGQNFLQDQEVARWIGDQVQPDDAPLVVEIGPGQGALTHFLLGRPKKLVLVEKDDELADALRIRFKDRTDVELRREDATRLDMRP